MTNSHTELGNRPVLFVCVENSCRSQIAEAFGNMYNNGKFDFYSSGSSPSGKINPKAISSMIAIGYDMDDHYSKSLEEIPKVHWAYVITMGCGDACAHLPATNHEDWPIPDPRHLDQEEFDEVLDQIKARVKDLIERAGKACKDSPA